MVPSSALANVQETGMIRSKTFWLAIVAILLFGAVLAAGDGASAWLRGWLSFSLLLAISVSLIFIVWRSVIGRSIERSLFLAVSVAFLLRLCLGAFFTQILPQIGYPDSQEHQSGYVFTDAYVRDRQAWELANTGAPLSAAFTGQYSGDQYGGMLALQALLYRSLSLDFHRQTLVLVLTAAIAALGVIFLWKASNAWFGRGVASLAAWIFALYPESLLLGSSQMREAFVITSIAMLFYSLTVMHDRTRLGKPSFAWLIWLSLAILILALFQPLLALVGLGLLLVLWLFDLPASTNRKGTPRSLAIGLLILFLLIVVLFIAASVLASLPSLQSSGPLSVFTGWLVNNFNFQSYLAERASGMLQKLIQTLGEQWTWLVVMVYGLAQPVLPAIVGDPGAAPVMRWIGFFRALGWYALAPFLVYGLLAALRLKSEPRRFQLIFLNLAIWVWAVIAAFNGGADQWDTPRYRTLLLAFQALLAAWAFVWARRHHDRWLYRWLAVEAIFVAMFTEWYASRYLAGLPHLDIFVMIPLTLLLCFAILLAGWLWDRRRRA
jgi:hypothetical protein